MFSIALLILLRVAPFASLAMASLDPTTLSQKLSEGVDILGTFNAYGGPMSNWMSTKPDGTPLENLNIPGTHDSAAWNFTGLEMQWVNCQDKPLFDQLDDGIRFLDLRFGLNGDSLSFYHGPSLLSNTAQLDDVFWGLYHWLDNHPSETVFVLLKVDNGSTTTGLQNTVRNLITGSPGSDYWYQPLTPMPTLGTARKKLVLIRRVVLDSSVSPFGYDFSSGWADNDASFKIQYLPSEAAYMEDLYSITNATDYNNKVAIKLNATVANLELAQKDKKSQLFISFVSGAGDILADGVTPKLLAEGNGTDSGMNSKTLSYLKPLNGSKFGIVLFDFYESEPNLVAAVAGVSPSGGGGGAQPSNTTTKSSPTHAASGASAYRWPTSFAFSLFVFSLVLAFW